MKIPQFIDSKRKYILDYNFYGPDFRYNFKELKAPWVTQERTVGHKMPVIDLSSV
jgi:hypothetical protein